MRAFAILCAGMVCTGAACDQKQEERPRPAVPGARPISLVAARGGRLAVLGSLDGRASYLQGRFIEVSRIAGTRDGRSVIVVNGPRDCRTKGGFEEGSYQPEIDQVVIGTGARKRIVGGADFPAVNAKGVVLVPGIASPEAKALVAYGDVCDGGGSLGFSDLVTGQNARRPPLGEAGYQSSSPPIESVRPLAWLSDGRTLFYVISVRGEAHPRYYFGRVWPLVTPAEEVIRRVAATLHEFGPDPTAAALVDDTTIAFAQDEATRSRVREWDVSTEGFIHADRSFQLPDRIVALTVDPAGIHFLAVTRSHVLYRWSVGDSAPTRLADGVSAAAWLP
jgi:hypothetical protein